MGGWLLIMGGECFKKVSFTTKGWRKNRGRGFVTLKETMLIQVFVVFDEIMQMFYNRIHQKNPETSNCLSKMLWDSATISLNYDSNSYHMMERIPCKTICEFLILCNLLHKSLELKISPFWLVVTEGHKRDKISNNYI